MVITSATRNRVVTQVARGFESHRLRQEQPYPNSKDTVAFIYFCYNGVAGIIIPTQIIEQRRSLHWKNLNVIKELGQYSDKKGCVSILTQPLYFIID